ncbi:uncharacterized protein LOC125674919 isoform X1 [Ostrea edulis]|uniref:uncharacterized protein LOC125674919 isoform X1 n=1 Tax=Ostrea edulis TaxID=37623 RepID=UPI0024AF71C6|nr:uncharacterized protein LOC125674919 isoform X1 [Ostrea edulis]
MNIAGYLTLIAVVIIDKTAAVSLLTGGNVNNTTNQNLVGVDSQTLDVFRQLLNQETIIRMNLVKNVDALMKNVAVAEQKISTIEASTDQEISVLKKEVQELKLENHVLKNKSRVQRRRLANITGYMNKTVDSLKVELKGAQIEQLKISSAVTSLEMFRMNLNNSKLDLKKKVAFTAGVTSSSTTWNSGTLVFPAVINNIGGGYNPSTGIFTAPTDGHYVFFVTVVEYGKLDNRVDIVQNGSSKVRTLGYSDAAYQTGTNMAVLRLQQGDTVWIRLASGKGYYSNSIPMTTFSGFRL